MHTNMQPFRTPRHSNQGQDGTNPRLICNLDRTLGYLAPQQKPSSTGGLPPVRSSIRPELPKAPMMGPFVVKSKYFCCPRANKLLRIPVPIQRQVIQLSLCNTTLSHRPLVQQTFNSYAAQLLEISSSGKPCPAYLDPESLSPPAYVLAAYRSGSKAAGVWTTAPTVPARERTHQA